MVNNLQANLQPGSKTFLLAKLVTAKWQEFSKTKLVVFMKIW